MVFLVNCKKNVRLRYIDIVFRYLKKKKTTRRGNGTSGEEDKRKREEIIHVYVRTNKDEHREIFNKYYIHFLTFFKTRM